MHVVQTLKTDKWAVPAVSMHVVQILKTDKWAVPAVAMPLLKSVTMPVQFVGRVFVNVLTVTFKTRHMLAVSIIILLCVLYLD